MFVVVVTGPPGAGKSTAATVLHDVLGDAGVASALVEVDELERCYPPLGRERALRHVAMVCGSFAEAGHDLLFVTATVEDDSYRVRLLEAIGPEEHLLVRLEAEPATLRERILAREPDGWSGLDELLGASQELARTMAGLPDVDLVVSTEELDPEQVAARIELVLRERGRVARTQV